jgi:probable addiction module antidote protein
LSFGHWGDVASVGDGVSKLRIHALGVVARAKGMTQTARDTGLSREQLHRSFRPEGNPTLKTTIAVMKALRMELTAKVPS